MDTHAAREALVRALDEYDNGTITRAAAVTVIEETVKDLFESGYNLGITVVDDDDADDDLDEDEYEIELEDEDDADDFRRET